MKVMENYPYVPYHGEINQRLTDVRWASGTWDFVALTSKSVPEIGPSVRFYGGTTATEITPCAPSLGFDIYGNCEVIIGEWMDESNCPNAFDPVFVKKITAFVHKHLPLLILLYLGKLRLSDALDYICGKDSWEIMLSGISHIPDEEYLRLQNADNPFELHILAFETGLYSRLCTDVSVEQFRTSVSPRLRIFAEPIFEDVWYCDEWMLTQYRGNARYVVIPENIVLIGEDVFAGHSEIEQVRFPSRCYGISDRAFSGCTNLQKLFLPDACDWIGPDAFAECTSLKTVIIPPKVIIGSGAFKYCIGLRGLDIPAGVSEIDEDAFLGCTNLIIQCKENSCAHIYAQEHGISYELQ